MAAAAPPFLMKEPLPGLYLSSEDGSPSWAEAGGQLKRRHFVIEGQTLKLFGRRGKTYKGHLNLLAVTALKVASESGAPPGALELQIKASRSRTQTCVLVPDHSVEELFMELGNAVPSHVVELDLWRRHMGSRPAVTSELYPREYRVGKTLGTGTFGKVCPRVPCMLSRSPLRGTRTPRTECPRGMRPPGLAGEARAACRRRHLRH